MSKVPTSIGDEFDGNPIVRFAVMSLDRFGGDLTREQAARLLNLWAYGHELSERERAAILARFAPEGDDDEDDQADEHQAAQGDHGWTSGTMGTTDA